MCVSLSYRTPQLEGCWSNYILKIRADFLLNIISVVFYSQKTNGFAHCNTLRAETTLLIISGVYVDRNTNQRET